MPRKARARLLWPEISTSERVNDLPLDAALLYTWMIAHADDQGRMLGSTRVIKAVVAPLQDELDESTIGVSLAIMENEGLIRLYKAGGREILQLLDWWEYQYPLRQPRPSKYPPPPGWREDSLADTFVFLWKSVRNKHVPYRGGIYVSVTGMRTGRRVKLTCKSTSAVPGSFWSSMGTVTGLCIAAFARMILDRKEASAGVLGPEAWVNAEEFYQAVARYGAPLKDFLMEAEEDLGPT